MKPIYCLKCKKETETTDMTESKTKNKRNVMKGVVQHVERINLFLFAL